MKSRFLMIALLGIGSFLYSMGAHADRIVLVTGGSRGLGAELVKGFRDAGDQVVILARTPPAQLSPGVYFVGLDLNNAESIHQAVAEVLARFGRIDVLVHNAGMTLVKSALHTGAADIAKSVATNFTGPFLLTQEALATRNVAAKLRVIYLSSLGAVVAKEKAGIYSGTKAAGEQVFIALADEIEKLPDVRGKVSISILRPGFVRSEYPVQIVAEAGEEATVASMDQLRSLSPTSSGDVVREVLRTSLAAKPPLLKNVGLETQVIARIQRLLSPRMSAYLRSLVEKVVPYVAGSRVCQNLMKKSFRLPGRVAALTAVLVGAFMLESEKKHALITPVTESAEFLYEFITRMQKRAEEITADSRAVAGKLVSGGFFLPYEAPRSAPGCEGWFHGKMDMNGNMGAFIDHWAELLKLGWGSINDRMYADLVMDFQKMTRGNPLLGVVAVNSVDEFWVEMRGGRMQSMLEIVRVKQFGVEVSETRWEYRRVHEPSGRNSFEESLTKGNCDPAAVTKFYLETFDPKKVKPGLKFDFGFRLEKFRGVVPPFRSRDLEFDHSLDFVGPGI